MAKVTLLLLNWFAAIVFATAAAPANPNLLAGLEKLLTQAHVDSLEFPMAAKGKKAKQE